MTRSCPININLANIFAYIILIFPRLITINLAVKKDNFWNYALTVSAVMLDLSHKPTPLVKSLPKREVNALYPLQSISKIAVCSWSLP